MKRVLIVTAFLATLTACGGTDPGSDPIPTIETSDTTTTDTTPPPTTTSTTSTTTSTTPPPALPATDVPDVVPPPVQPAPYTPPPVQPAPYTPPPVQPAPYTPPPVQAPPPAYYANCTEARAAGAAPLYRGDPGYRSGLDRDDDGVACET